MASIWVPQTKVDWFLTILRVVALTVVFVGLLAFIAQQIDVDNPFARWANPDATGLTGAQFRGLVVSGLAQGAMYGLIALGYSMVYGVLGFINFAHGEAAPSSQRRWDPFSRRVSSFWCRSSSWW